MSTNDDIRLLLCEPATLGEVTADGVHGRFALAGGVHNPDMFGAVEAAPGLYLLPETGWREGAALCVGEARPVGDDAGLGTTVSAAQKGAIRHRLEGAPCWKGKGYLLFCDTANDYRIIFPRPTREKLAEHYRAFESSPSLRNFNFEYHAFVLCRAIGRETLDGLDVLDVASGNGSFLSVLRGKGADVTGFEPSESECREAAKTGLELINAPFTPAMLPEGRQYDVVIAGNIFEHVPDPVPFMERIRARLKPGGWLFFQIPNDFNAIQMKYLERSGSDAWFVAPPDHLNYWDVPQARRFVDAQGFDVVHEEAQFPIEMFLLMGMDYRKQPELGRQAHLMRCAFEDSFADDMGTLSRFYASLIGGGFGRDYVAVLRKRP